VLRDSELLYERGIFPQATYIFRHSLTQEVAYDSLLLKRRKEIHERIGKAMEELYPDRLEELYEVLAYHYARSENLEKAYQYLKLSGEKAARSYSHWEAFRFYKQAINMLNRLPGTKENKGKGIEIRLLMSGPMRPLAYPEDSLEILQEGEKLARELGDERSLTKFHSVIGVYHVAKGGALLGRKYAEDCFKEAEKVEDIELMAQIGYDLCIFYNAAGEYSRIASLAPRVLALLESTQRESECFGRPFNPYSAILAMYGYAMGELGNFEEGQTLCEKALRFVVDVGNPHSILWAEFFYGMLLNLKGDGRNAVPHFENAVRYCEERQNVTVLGFSLSGLGWGHQLLGDLETAQRHMEKGLEVQRDAGISLQLSLHYYLLSEVHLELGDLENARTYAKEALRLAQDNNERNLEGVSRLALGRVLGKAEKSQFAEAEEYILQGIAIMDELKLKPSSYIGYLYLGELYADTDQREKALGPLKKAQGMFQEMGMDYWLRRTQSVLAKLEG